MCGLLGWNFKDKPPKGWAVMVACLLDNNDRRGGDSFGLYIPEIGVKKALGAAVGQLLPQEVEELPTLMGHTRKATHGGKTLDNCHPFEIGNVIGAHNGMLNNHTELNTKFGRTFQVDSQHIFANINENLPMSSIEGYGAIEFVKKETPNEIFLNKFNGGSLWMYGIGKNMDNCEGIVWSSEKTPIELGAKLIGLPVFPFDSRDGMVYHVKDGMLYHSTIKLYFAYNRVATTGYVDNYYGSRYQSDNSRSYPTSRPSRNNSLGVKQWDFKRNDWVALPETPLTESNKWQRDLTTPKQGTPKVPITIGANGETRVNPPAYSKKNRRNRHQSAYPGNGASTCCATSSVALANSVSVPALPSSAETSLACLAESDADIYDRHEVGYNDDIIPDAVPDSLATDCDSNIVDTGDNLGLGTEAEELQPCNFIKNPDDEEQGWCRKHQAYEDLCLTFDRFQNLKAAALWYTPQVINVQASYCVSEILAGRMPIGAGERSEDYYE